VSKTLKKQLDGATPQAVMLHTYISWVRSNLNFSINCFEFALARGVEYVVVIISANRTEYHWIEYRQRERFLGLDTLQ
jgi:hypothetical protein